MSEKHPDRDFRISAEEREPGLVPEEKVDVGKSATARLEKMIRTVADRELAVSVTPNNDRLEEEIHNGLYIAFAATIRYIVRVL